MRGLRWFGACLKNRIHGLTRLHNIHPGNEWLAKFLFNHLEEWFVFLRLADLVEATNNVWERALRFNIAARKLSVCNRKEIGARAQEILPSATQTCLRFGKDLTGFLMKLINRQTLVSLYDNLPTSPRIA